MFYSDDAINSLLNYSKILVNEINQKKNKDVPEELKGIQYLLFAGMISYYGFERISLIYKTFEVTHLIHMKGYTLEQINQLFVQKGGSLSFSNQQNYAFLIRQIFRDPMSRFHIQYHIYSFDIAQSFDSFLEQLVHEVNHVMNSVAVPIGIRQGHMVCRCGLSVYDLENRVFDAKNFEESINVLQAAEITNHILDFSNYQIYDPEIRRVVERISHRNIKKRTGFGYDFTVPLLRPLYQDPYFYPLFVEKRISGDTAELHHVFKKKLGEASYTELKKLLDDLNEKDEDSFTIQKQQNKVKMLVKKCIQ